jgi:CheY-like chemotaxis protein
MADRILVVDDDDAFRYAMAKALKDAGYTVVEAPDYRKALDILDDGQPLALLLTDIKLPSVHGFAVARMATMKNLNIKTIFVTGYDDIPTTEATGPIFHKPVEVSVILAEIRTQLAARKTAP